MDVQELEKIIGMLERSAVTEFQLEREGATLRIVREVAAVPAGHLLVQQAPEMGHENRFGVPIDKASAAEEGLARVESPIVGNYYSKPSPEAEPFVRVGSQVKKGDTLCIVEAMKLMNEIEAPVSGTIEKIFLSDGHVVEYGEVLFLIKPL